MQWVKDLALSLQWLGSLLLWHGFNPWLRNFYVLQEEQEWFLAQSTQEILVIIIFHHLNVYIRDSNKISSTCLLLTPCGLAFKILCTHHTHTYIYFVILGPHLRHREVPRLGVESELKLLAYAIATPDLSQVCDPYRSSWQCQILNPLSEARDQTCNPHEY